LKNNIKIYREKLSSLSLVYWIEYVASLTILKESRICYYKNFSIVDKFTSMMRPVVI